MGSDKLTPAQRQREVMHLKFPGKLCIMTICSGVYQHFAPMFRYCIAKEIPEADSRVYVHGEQQFTPEVYQASLIETNELKHFGGDGLTTAALRFLYSDPTIEQYDYVLITDVDILFKKEPVSIVNQHMRNVVMNGTECYDNYNQGGIKSPILPGVHFVTKDWWRRTADKRKEFMAIIRTATLSKGHDESMLGQLVMQCGLPTPSTRQNMGAVHGIHIGTYRKAEERRHKLPILDAECHELSQRLIHDEGFMELAKECEQHIPWLKNIWSFLSKPMQ